MSAILKFDFQKRKQLRFSEVNYLNYAKRPNFACDNYIFPKTRINKNHQWTHSTPLNKKNLVITRHIPFKGIFINFWGRIQSGEEFRWQVVDLLVG